MPNWDLYDEMTTPADDDTALMHDVSETIVGKKMKKITWANIKATLKTYFDTLYLALVAPGTSGNVLTSNGTAWTSAAPASGDGTKTLRGTISNPQAVYAQAASLPIMKADAALTITGIYIDTRQTAQEMAGDLKFADDQTIGSLANASVIDVCDTTSGVFFATSGFDDATVPGGKYIYYQFDASPNAAIKDFTLRITYTYD